MNLVMHEWRKKQRVESGKFKSALTRYMSSGKGIETFIVFLSADKLQTKFRSRSAYLRTVINEREWNCLTLLVAKAKVPVPQERTKPPICSQHCYNLRRESRVQITLSKKCINVYNQIEIASRTCDKIYFPMNNYGRGSEIKQKKTNCGDSDQSNLDKYKIVSLCEKIILFIACYIFSVIMISTRQLANQIAKLKFQHNIMANILSIFYLQLCNEIVLQI